MRFLQITTAGAPVSGPPDPEHMAKVRKAIGEAIESGRMLATGGIGKRATSAARIIRKDGNVTVEDPPKEGADSGGWMAGGGYALTEYTSKEEAIADCRKKLDIMGDGTMEMIQVSEMYPVPKNPAMPAGVVPYLSFDGASEAAAFYGRAFGAREISRMPGEDGKRLMHCHLEINGGGFMLSDNFPEYGLAPVQRSASYTMQLVVADGDAWWDRAVKAGCKEKMPFAVAPWGDKYGQLIDPFGVTWAINSPPKK
ncbi:MAG: glyoxalase/bleomycin resistance/extradiol dioxygenase family protein [Hyphomonadaceae bacterium]|nr:glyoxalase/bleomycin resistance/extradiol dioxygenase family protein [Hyphomonadaceae bacterium]